MYVGTRKKEMGLQKRVIRTSPGHSDMGLLQELFPGLDGIRDVHLPTWGNLSEPWAILGERGLISQIQDFTGKLDGVFIHPSAKIGDFVVVEGPCYVGPDVEVRHGAFLRKGSWICDGCIVGHSTEVKNSLLLPGSKAPHFNYVGDSILGIGVNLGAGTKLSNVRNDRGSIPITNEKGERNDSGLRKLGAIIGDGSQLGCNVVTNPGAIISPGTMVSPNETVSGWIS